MLSGGRQIWIWRRNSQVGYEGSRRSEEEIMNYNEVLANARENIGKYSNRLLQRFLAAEQQDHRCLAFS